MRKLTKGIVAGSAALALGLTLGACSEADTASENLSTAADNFEINRRIVFFNGITDTYLLEIEGRCSIETSDSYAAGALEVTCKIADDEYKKHFLGLSDNVSFFVEQIESADVSAYHYQIRFRPETIVPEIDLQTSNEETD